MVKHFVTILTGLPICGGVYNNATAAGSSPEIHLSATSTNNTITGNVVTSTGATLVLNGAHSPASGNVGYNTAPAAAANFKPANPPATTSGTLVMMGLGSTVTFTPTDTGKMAINLTCQIGD